MAKEKFEFELPSDGDVTILPATYAYNSSDVSPALASYLKFLAELASTEDLRQDLREPTRILSIVFTVFAAMFVGLRLLARIRKAARIGADDYLAAFALVVLVGNMVINLILVHQGLGLHSGLLTLEQLEALYKNILGAEVLYVVGVNAFKLSLLVLYYRLFPIRSMKLAGYIIGTLSSAWCVACVFVAVFQCSPRNLLWQGWVEGTCLPILPIQLLTAVPSLLCDLAILCLPVQQVLRLKMTSSQKAMVFCMFLFGGFVVFTGVYRFLLVLGLTYDIPYTLALPLAWDVVEIGSGIIAACLPTLGPVFPDSSARGTLRDSVSTGGGVGSARWKDVNESVSTVGDTKSAEA